MLRQMPLENRVIRQESREMPFPAETAELVQRGSSLLRQRNRLLALTLATVAAAALIVTVTVVLVLHNAEAGHAIAGL
jgi:hypothetical protein